MFLTPDDVARLTGRKRFSAQRRALDALGIRYTRAATGEPLVRADALEGGRKRREPRFDRMVA